MKLNADQSKLLITCRPTDRQRSSSIILKAATYNIEQSNKVKVLGVYYTSGLDNTANVQNIIQKVILGWGY